VVSGALVRTLENQGESRARARSYATINLLPGNGRLNYVSASAGTDKAPENGVAGMSKDVPVPKPAFEIVNREANRTGISYVVIISY
jgi:hypothetical protein